MNDCSNAEIRDQLPDLLHDRLAVSMRDVVVAHVADCADCREELELLRGAHVVLVSETPRIDISRIVAALPKPPVADRMPGVTPLRTTVRTPARRMMRMDWRIAAAVTFLAVGGSSVALLNRAPTADRALADSGLAAPVVQTTAPIADVQRADTQVAANTVASSSAAVSQTNSSEESVADVQAAADVSPGGRFAGLTEEQMKALLGDIGELPAVPVTEPDPVAIQVVNSGSATTGGW